MPIVGPVKKHLDDWEEAGRKGWRVKISELSETIDAYEGDPDAPDSTFWDQQEKRMLRKLLKQHKHRMNPLHWLRLNLRILVK